MFLFHNPFDSLRNVVHSFSNSRHDQNTTIFAILLRCFWRLVWGMAFIFCQGYTHENTSIVIISTSWVALFSMMLLRFRTKTLPKASFARDYVKDLFYRLELIWFACRIGFMKCIAFLFCTASFLLVAFFPGYYIYCINDSVYK